MGRAVLAALCAVVLLVPAAHAADAGTAPFPRGFLWGVATSGFQTEMGRGRDLDRRSDWWAWTHDAANRRTGKVTRDRPEDGPGSWARWRDDVRIASHDLHLRAFRLSIEWSRIFPRSTASVAGGALDAAALRDLDRLADRRALAHYRAELRGIRAAGMEPFVTLQHFTLPLWLHDPIAERAGHGRRGWLDPRTVTEFRRYAGYLAWKLGDLVTYWTPINEPLVQATFGYANVPGVFGGYFPPGASSFPDAVRAVRAMEAANTTAYAAIHRLDRHARVGLVQNMIAFTPADPASAADVAATGHADRLFNRLFLDAAVRGDVDADADGTIAPAEHAVHGRAADFIGVDYYFRGRVSALGAPLTPAVPLLDFLPQTGYRWALAPKAPPCPTTCSDFGSELYPEGFGAVLREAAGYGLPLYVTETGIADARDVQRPRFLVGHLLVLRRAIAAGVPVRGLFHWSLTDNFEWSSGYAPKFGLYRYDRRTLARHPRPSARIFARIARTGRVAPDLAARLGGAAVVGVPRRG